MVMDFKKLINIQQKLKAPKGQYNNFGKYAYRSCEDILEAVKPILAEEQCALILQDDVVFIGERYYIRSKAVLYDENGEIIAENSAYAREETEKKGMDGSQITGASTSYARKYALNGLFGIDDNKDSDTTNTGEDKPNLEQKQTYKKDNKQQNKVQDKQSASARKVVFDQIRVEITKAGLSEEWVCNAYKISKLEDLKSEQIQPLLARCKEMQKNKD